MKTTAGLAMAAIKENRTAELRTFYAAKSVAKGNGAYIDETMKAVESIVEITGQAKRTVLRHFKKFVAWDWFGKDKKGTYYVRSLSHVAQKLGATEEIGKHPTAVGFLAASRELFRSYLFAVAVSVLVKRRRRKANRVPSTCGTDQRDLRGYQFVNNKGEITLRERFNAHTLSLSFLSERIGCSTATVHRLKMLAIDHGFLKREKHRHEISSFKWTPKGFVETGKATDVAKMRMSIPEEAHRLYKPGDKDCVVINLTDEIFYTLENVQ